MKIEKMTNRFCGSITVEATLVLPVFIFVFTGILYLNQLLYGEEQVQCALEQAAKETSLEYTLVHKKLAVNAAFMSAKVNAAISGRKNKNRSIVCVVRAKVDEETDQMDFQAEYTVVSPISLLGKKTFLFREGYYGKAFTGVLTRMSESEQGEDVLVYVTKTGSVYHKSITCNHLKLSLQELTVKELEEKRSRDGSIYYPCEKCCGGNAFPDNQNVIICNYGNRYHVKKNCQKISRSIREIPISQVNGKAPCKTCANGKE